MSPTAGTNSDNSPNDSSATSLGPPSTETSPVVSDGTMSELSAQCSSVACGGRGSEARGYTEMIGSATAQAGELPQSPKEAAKESGYVVRPFG